MSSWSTIGNFKGPTGSTGAPGTSFTFRGSWVSTTAYAINDVVTRLGSTYIYVAANTGSDPQPMEGSIPPRDRQFPLPAEAMSAPDRSAFRETVAVDDKG
jgi:hypothetical protein